ncbi:hypothetical protein SBOR_6315 [Sclerotinia borealis F-4128]|uniref:Uncharacterized protein n=1 Tax=Sclerotinia borealis (strain F-4128) TaxID=1432307 RepID=W9C933_SCLBF|nr:hypothetical protein SBOR_6315 [Sclerotinia borealis F-4128]
MAHGPWAHIARDCLNGLFNGSPENGQHSWAMLDVPIPASQTAAAQAIQVQDQMAHLVQSPKHHLRIAMNPMTTERRHEVPSNVSPYGLPSVYAIRQPFRMNKPTKIMSIILAPSTKMQRSTGATENHLDSQHHTTSFSLEAKSPPWTLQHWSCGCARERRMQRSTVTNGSRPSSNMVQLNGQASEDSIALQCKRHRSLYFSFSTKKWGTRCIVTSLLTCRRHTHDIPVLAPPKTIPASVRSAVQYWRQLPLNMAVIPFLRQWQVGWVHTVKSLT